MKIMIVTDHLAFCDSNYTVFSNVNKTVDQSLNEVSIAPINLSNKIVEIDTAVVNIAEISSFYDGVLLCTTIEQAYEIVSAHTNAIKCLYLWDLDWMNELFEYEYVYDILANQKLNIIVRSESHKKEINRLCPECAVKVLPDFNLEKIWNSLKETEMQL